MGTVIVALDKFKGSIDAAGATAALTRGLHRLRPDQLGAGRAEHDAATDPVEQRHPELPLQAGDGLGQRGLRDVQLLGGPAESVVVDDREEVLQLTSVHPRPPTALIGRT